MSTKVDAEKIKLIQDKCQVILGNLLREEDNKYCVDCDAKGPRWASWNLGVFLCIRCAGIHRNLGVHISKVKSVNLDTWNPEQVAYLQQMGNSQARAVYEANLPENFRRPQTDSSLEAFIRAKYEQKKYIAKEWVPPPPPPPAFDIDEEKKKERERKKNKTKALPQHPTAVPRPHSTGPHSPAIQPESLKQIQQVPDSSDLLNLGGGGDGNIGNTNNSETDLFDAFLSAPASIATDKAPVSVTSTSEMAKSNVTNEETDFFNQKAVSDANKANKMTKESILSLYGSTTVQIPATQHIAPMYGVPVTPDGKFIYVTEPKTPQKIPPYSLMHQNKIKFINSSAKRKLFVEPYMTPPKGVTSKSFLHVVPERQMYISSQAFAQVGMPGYPSVPAQGISPCNTGSNMPAVYNPFSSIGTPGVRQDPRNQPNTWIGISPGGRDESLLMAHGMGQVTQQVASLQIAGQPWSMAVNAPSVNASGMVINTNQTVPGAVWPPNSQNQNFSNNVWQ